MKTIHTQMEKMSSGQYDSRANSRIFIAAHKPMAVVPIGYELVQAGAANNPGHRFAKISDDQGKNISKLNTSYCEVTVLYWIWMNSVETSVGLVHYRRFFARSEWISNINNIYSKNFLINRLSSCDIIVPKSVEQFMPLEKQYKRFHHINDLFEAKKFIDEHCPEYTASFNETMKQTRIYPYNMFVMKFELFDEYMTWLMPILNHCYLHCDQFNYDAYNKRMVGFLSERLFNVWLRAHPDFKILELPVTKIDDSFYMKLHNKIRYLVKSVVYKI